VTGVSSKGGGFRVEAVGDLPASDVDAFIQSKQLAEIVPPDSKKDGPSYFRTIKEESKEPRGQGKTRLCSRDCDSAFWREH